ncbi:MAG: RDD family protein [Thermoleophilaceae bacterium]
MEYEDVITVPTPEGVELELTLAGAGSRFASTIVDVLLEGVILLGLLAALSQVLSLSGLGEQGSTAIIAAVGSLAAFLVIFGYHVLFETLASGRTPGKRLMGLRVARVGGNPVRFRESAVRNLVRLVDIVPPPLYGVGAVAILAGRRNQRLGDVAAGTLVVRERHGDRVRPHGSEAVDAPAQTPPVAVSELGAWDVSAIDADELSTVRRFLERRETLGASARAELAEELTARLRPKVAGAHEGLTAEQFLERLAAAKAARI